MHALEPKSFEDFDCKLASVAKQPGDFEGYAAFASVIALGGIAPYFAAEFNWKGGTQETRQVDHKFAAATWSIVPAAMGNWDYVKSLFESAKLSKQYQTFCHMSSKQLGNANVRFCCEQNFFIFW